MPRYQWTVPLACGLLLTAVACGTSDEPAKTTTATVPPPTAAPAQAPPPASAPFRVVAVDLGNAIGADKKVTAPAATFTPNDTIYASVTTDGTTANVSLKARWTYEGDQLVNESAQSVAPTGPAVFEFHIAKPDGWPTGKYKVEVSANGVVAMAKEFVVTN